MAVDGLGRPSLDDLDEGTAAKGAVVLAPLQTLDLYVLHPRLTQLPLHHRRHTLGDTHRVGRVQ